MNAFYIRAFEAKKGMLTSSKELFISEIISVKYCSDTHVRIDLDIGQKVKKEIFNANDLIFVSNMLEEVDDVDWAATGWQKVDSRKIKRFMYEGHHGIVTKKGFVHWATLSCSYTDLKGDLYDMVCNLLNIYICN